MRSRGGAFTLLAVGCTIVAAIAVLSAVLAQGDTTKTPLRSALTRPYVVFRAIDKNAGPAHLGELTSTEVADPGKVRRGTGRLCERVYAVAAGGICLARSRSLVGA